MIQPIKSKSKETKLKINSPVQPVRNVSASDTKNRTDNAPSSTQESVEDAVRISQQAASMQSAEGSSESNAVIDVSRVQEIKQAISEGTFKVNPDVVADRLLETVKELIQEKNKEDQS